LAERALRIRNSVEISHVSPEDEVAEIGSALYAQIHAIKLQLNRYPQNPILRIRLARLYLCAGHGMKAVSQARIAVQLAPSSRYVVRSAARIFLHQGDGERAHRILVDCPAAKEDPWIMAAEVAIAAAVAAPPVFLTIGRRVLERGAFSHGHTSELSSAIGTLEATGGNSHAGRKFLRQSLTSPSENAFAQAAWLQEHVPNMNILDQPSTCSAEANAWLLKHQNRFADSLGQAQLWFVDQPFSSRPAIFGSFLASRQFDFDTAMRFARRGLIANPDDNVLLNNLAFSLAQTDNVKGAEQAIKRVSFGRLTVPEQISFTATQGLIAFRKGDVTVGREYYLKSAELAKDAEDGRIVPAMIYHAIEERRANTPEAAAYVKKAIEAVTGKVTAEDEAIFKELVGPVVEMQEVRQSRTRRGAPS
jgi:predicted Zn-dependent protease